MQTVQFGKASATWCISSRNSRFYNHIQSEKWQMSFTLSAWLTTKCSVWFCNRSRGLANTWLIFQILVLISLLWEPLLEIIPSKNMNSSTVFRSVLLKKKSGNELQMTRLNTAGSLFCLDWLVKPKRRTASVNLTIIRRVNSLWVIRMNPNPSFFGTQSYGIVKGDFKISRLLWEYLYGSTFMGVPL